MRTWAKRHTPTAILIPTALATGTATALTNVPEIFPFGQELGLVAMGVGYSYIAAYIFNWLVVVRPRANALKGYYAAAKSTLLRLALEPASTVHSLYVLARVPHDQVPRGATRKDLMAVLQSIDWKDESQEAFYRDLLRGMSGRLDPLYQRAVPLLAQFEPAVSVAIADLHADTVLGKLELFADNPSWLAQEGFRHLLASELVSYQQAGRNLGRALIESNHTPDWKPRTREALQYIGLEGPSVRLEFDSDW